MTLISKFELFIRTLELKWSEAIGNKILQQSKKEQILNLQIRIQIAKEQALNQELFSSI